MAKKTKGAGSGDVGLQVQANCPGAFSGASTDGCEALLDLARGAGDFVAGWSGRLRWAGLVEAVWPQLCVARRFGLTDREMAPVISEAVRMVRPDIRLAAVGRVKVEDRSLELSRSTLRDAMARYEARAPYPWRQYAVVTLARRRAVDIATVDPVVAAEMDVAVMRSKAGLKAEGRISGEAFVMSEPNAAGRLLRSEVSQSSTDRRSHDARTAGSSKPRRSGVAGSASPEPGSAEVGEFGAVGVEFDHDEDPFAAMDRAEAEVEKAAAAARAAAEAETSSPSVPSQEKSEEPKPDGPAMVIDLEDLSCRT